MEALTLTVRGLYTDPNSFSDVPEGALIEALDMVIDKPGVGESRRGQKKYGLIAGIPDKAFQYRGRLLVHYGEDLARDDGVGSFTEYSGTFDTPSPEVKNRSVEANQNFYITSAAGVQKIDSLNSEFVPAGAPAGLNGTYSLSDPGFMADQVQVAYRMVWGYRDDNDNEIVGTPSSRLVVVNDTGLTADVTQTWLIPDEITTDWFYRVYRSGESAGVDFPPDDNLQQVKEGSPTSGEITAGAFTFTDNVPNSLRGAALYTNPNQEGLLQSNFQPPFCFDMCNFRNSVFYFNTKIKQRLFVNLVSVGDNTLGGSFGYQTNNGDTHTNTTIDGLTKAASFIIQDLTYTADTAGVAGNDISITYTAGATAGAEVVTVDSNSISVQIEDGVSTATQIKTAVDASVPAAALVDVVISGTGSNPQDIVAQTFLEDGFDTTYLNVGMRVVGTGVVAGTLISSIDSASAITVDTATTATATVALEFQDRFSIDSMNYWAASTADYANRQFIAVITGTPGSDIEATAMNLIDAINQDPNNSLVYAYYTSNYNDLPGQILLAERQINGSVFYITSTNGESFSPELSLTSQTVISDPDERQNRVFFSKIQQPEAVPLVNYLDVGSENYAILRGIALRDSIFVFKEVEGIFRITGTDATTYTVSLFDSSAVIRAPESAVVLNNQIFCFSDQGIIVVSENGVQIISIPIQSVLNEISSDLYTNFETATFGVSYETDRRYILFTVATQEDEYATQAFVFNTITNAFTRWYMPRSCGIVLSSDTRLYAGNPDDNYIYRERKDFIRTDYADDDFDVTIVSYDELEVTLSDTTGISEGDVLKQGDYEAVVESVDSSTVITVNFENPWVAGTAQIFEVIPATAIFDHNAVQNPGILKHFSEATFLFKDAAFYSFTAGFKSNLMGSYENFTVENNTSLGWGEDEWGEFEWGGPLGGEEVPIRTLVPLEAQRASWLNVKVQNKAAFANFSLLGVTLGVEPMSSRQR